MSIAAANEITFSVGDGDVLSPTFTNGQRARRITIRNRDQFADMIADGATFAINIITVEGSGRVPKNVVVEIVRPIIRLKGDGLGEDFWIDPEILQMILADIACGHHVLFKGPKGTGKTTLAKLLADNFGVPFIKVDGSGIFKPKDLFGSETANEGTLSWVPSDLARFIEEHRERKGWPKAIVLMDEFSRMGQSMAPFHALFDHTASYSFTTCDGTMTIDGLEGIIFIMTDNPTGNGYFGTHDLDEAMEDRVEPYDFHYPPSAWEIAWLIRQTGIGETEAAEIVTVANAIREICMGEHMTAGGPSPRRSLRAARMVVRGIAMQVAVRHKLVYRYRGSESDSESERGMIVAALKSKQVLADARPRVMTRVAESTSS